MEKTNEKPIIIIKKKTNSLGFAAPKK